MRFAMAIHPMAVDKLTETNYLIPQTTLNLQEKSLLCLRIREA